MESENFMTTGTKPPVTSNEHALDIGRNLARQLFSKRGNNAEVHLSELDLAAVCTLAAERALSIVTAHETSEPHMTELEQLRCIDQAARKFVEKAESRGEWKSYPEWHALNAALFDSRSQKVFEVCLNAAPRQCIRPGGHEGDCDVVSQSEDV